MLSILIFLPLIAALLILVLPSRFQQQFKYITLGVSLIQFVLSLFIYLKFNSSTLAAGINKETQYQLVEKLPWIRLNLGNIGNLEIDYFLGIDGLSMPFLILSALVTFVATLASWEIKTKLKAYFSLFLLLNTAVIGVFCALDFFLFYIFYELMLLPLYFLIGIWGGIRREYAAIKFFLYTKWYRLMYHLKSRQICFLIVCFS
jgi:NADH-quinone oxidoreductase subunit M